MVLQVSPRSLRVSGPSNRLDLGKVPAETMGCASSSASSPPLRTKGGNPDEVAALTTKLRTRGKNVFAEPIDKDWQPVVHPKSDASKQIIRTALKNNTFSALFEEMKESELDLVVA